MRTETAKTDEMAVRIVRKNFDVALRLAKSMVASAKETGIYTTWNSNVVEYENGLYIITTVEKGK